MGAKRGQDLLQQLEHEVVVADGAMGTVLCARGIPWNACLEGVNLTRPDLVKAIHLEYVEAGSGLVETNTFGANRNKLAAADMADKAGEINAARLARSAIPEDVYLAGSVGPFGRIESNEEVSDETRYETFRSQIEVLLEEGVDVILLETFSQVQELKLALQAVKDLDSEIPVICQMAFTDVLRSEGGADTVRALLDFERLGASVIGGNCGAGPLGLIRVVEGIAPLTRAKLSAQPNAGYPQYVNGRSIYMSDPSYFAESAERLVNAGANLVGGCCGTTPDHIRGVVGRVGGRPPAGRRVGRAPGPPNRPRRRPGRQSRPSLPRRPGIYSPIDRVGTTKVVIVKVKPPRGMAMGAVRRAAKRLKEAGVDAYSLVESSLAQVRMNPFAVGHLLQEEFGIAAVVHCTCRDRNLMGQQSELTGAVPLGIRTVLALTGDPASMGDASGSSSVYDTNSLGLIELIVKLNGGRNIAGNPISGSGHFVVGAGFDPNVRRLDPAIKRLEKKVQTGAQFVMTQPVFHPQRVADVYEATNHLDIPVFLGVMPLISHRNAIFLHNEVPGIRIPPETLTRMASAGEDAAAEEGFAVAREIIDAALDSAPGFYIMPQLESYQTAARLVRYVKQGSEKLKLQDV